MVKCSQLYFFLLCATYWKNVRTQRNRQFEFPNVISKNFLLLVLKIMHHHFKSRNTQFPQNSKQIIKKVRVFFCHWSLFWFWTDAWYRYVPPNCTTHSASDKNLCCRKLYCYYDQMCFTFGISTYHSAIVFGSDVQL